MPSRLDEITDEIHETLNDATVVKRFGPKHLAHHEQERRIVWVRSTSPIEPPNQAGGRKVTGSPEHRVVACMMRIETVEAHVYAESDELLDQLLDNIIAATFLTLSSSVVFNNYSWVSHESGESGEILRTEKVIVRMSVKLPVPEEIKQLTPVDSIDHVCGVFVEDGDLVPQPE